MTSEPIDLADVRVSASSYVDPNGFLFEHGGRLFRAVRSQVSPFYRRLLDDRTVVNLISSGRLVATRPADVTLGDPAFDLFLRHDRIEPLTFCVEWTPDMLKDAALLTLDLLDELVEKDSTLSDAYPWNILFQGAKPVFVDFTSITPASGNLIWPAYDQFVSFFLRPLELMRLGKGKIARGLLFDNIAGIGRRDFIESAGSALLFRRSGLVLGLWLDEWFQSRPALKAAMRRSLSRLPNRVDARLRRQFVRRLRAQVESIRFPARRDAWSEYYRQLPGVVDRNVKVKAVEGIVDRLRPETVTDVGCNAGVFSLIAARAGARVIAIDGSEACVNSLYLEAKRENLPITPLVANLVCPTPPFGFLGNQYPGLVERVPADLVFCLGLMHHLHVSGRQSFERIALLMDRLAKRHLVFEFVSMEDENNDLIGAGREIRYDLDSVLAALKRHFPEVVQLDSDRPTRKLLVCSKPS